MTILLVRFADHGMGALTAGRGDVVDADAPHGRRGPRQIPLRRTALSRGGGRLGVSGRCIGRDVGGLLVSPRRVGRDFVAFGDEGDGDHLAVVDDVVARVRVLYRSIDGPPKLSLFAVTFVDPAPEVSAVRQLHRVRREVSAAALEEEVERCIAPRRRRRARVGVDESVGMRMEVALEVGRRQPVAADIDTEHSMPVVAELGAGTGGGLLARPAAHDDEGDTHGDDERKGDREEPAAAPRPSERCGTSRAASVANHPATLLVLTVVATTHCRLEEPRSKSTADARSEALEVPGGRRTRLARCSRGRDQRWRVDYDAAVVHNPGVEKTKIQKLVGPLEAEVLDVLWSTAKPMGVREVLDVVNDDRNPPLAYTTVMTVMSRLADKGILGRERVGRGYTDEPMARDAAEIAVRNVVRDFGDAAIARFVDEARTDPELMGRLRRLVEET